MCEKCYAILTQAAEVIRLKEALFRGFSPDQKSVSIISDLAFAILELRRLPPEMRGAMTTNARNLARAMEGPEEARN